MLLKNINSKTISDAMYDYIIQHKTNGALPPAHFYNPVRFVTLSNKFTWDNQKLYINIKSKTLNSINRRLEYIFNFRKTDHI